MTRLLSLSFLGPVRRNVPLSLPPSSASAGPMQNLLVRRLATHARDQPNSSRRRLAFNLEDGPSLRQSISKVQEREQQKQKQRLSEMHESTRHIPPFRDSVQTHTREPFLQRGQQATTMQINIGKFCNLTCRHCHVESGPSKRLENMNAETVERCIYLLAKSPCITTLDITGGAPELNPHFRHLVVEARKLGKRVIDRCNLVVLFEQGQEDLVSFLAANKVHIVASLPCYLDVNTDQQRGANVHMDSVHALKALNAAGYAKHADLTLDLVYNPIGANLPPPQETLEESYRTHLKEQWGIVFDSLLAITNMPIKRFADDLVKQGEYQAYMEMLQRAFNVSTVDKLMCKNTINVQWDGQLFDCDFNAALDLQMHKSRDIWSIDSLDEIHSEKVHTAKHCYGCTAGSGSSCGGRLAL